MKLQQLETFFWTVHLGSFAAAAGKLFTTQSTVSLRIRELERSLGVELFDRSARKAVLTPKGRELMDYATRIVDLASETQHRLASPETLSGTVRLGVAEMVSVTWLPRLMQAIAARYPRVRLEIEEALTGDLMTALHSGDLDVVLAPGRPPILDTATLPLGAVEFAWMASPSMGLGAGPHRAADLSRQPIIGLKSQSFHHASIDDWFRRDGVRCAYLARCKSMGVAASMTLAGVGIAFLPRRSHVEDIRRGALEVLRTTAPFGRVDFIAAVSTQRVNPLADAVATLARESSDFDGD